MLLPQFGSSTDTPVDYVPMVIDSDKGRERAYDIFSRLMKDRIVMIGTEINHHVANSIVAQLLFLTNKNHSKPIHMYINSPGGSITDGMAIYDTMKYIPNKVYTYCIGMCASMGAILLAAGDKRYALPNSRIMIHQPLGGARGQATDVEIQAAELCKWKVFINDLLSDLTKQPLDVIRKDTDRDFYMSAVEAKKYGLVDEVLAPTVKVDDDGSEEAEESEDQTV